MSGIGLLNEKSLHASLKQWCAQPGDRFEVAVDGFVIDLVRDDRLLEIQTRNFAAIKTKLTKLVAAHRVRLVHPIAQEKWIIKLAKDNGDVESRRKSPKRGRLEDLFREMVSFPQLLAHPNFSLQVLLIKEEEVRRYVGQRRRRKQGWATEERRLVEVVGQRLFEGWADWQALLPQTLNETFTTSDLAAATGIRKALAQKEAYCLAKVGVIRAIGKRGRFKLYEIVKEGLR